MLDSPFNRVAVLQACNFIEMRNLMQIFPVNIAKFCKNIYFEEHLQATASEKTKNQQIKACLQKIDKNIIGKRIIAECVESDVLKCRND